jgi:ABC-2 type transport system permease protein
MAGMNPSSPFSVAPGLTREQFRTIAWLRWRIFVNTLRGKGAAGELVARVLSYPLLALMIIGPAVGAGFGTWLIVTTAAYSYLAIPLWLIFALWQFIGVSTSASGPSFDLTILIRFPIRYRDYLLMRLSFGLLDPPTMAGIACLVAMSIGIGIAAPALAIWCALVLFFYALCNILFSRMVYTWIERLLAQRRTRELFTVLLVAVSLGVQVVVQFAQKLGAHGGPTNPLLQRITHTLLAINWFLPPGLAASAIDHMHGGASVLAGTALLGLLFFSGVFLFILHLRLHAEYLGENLSEAPRAIEDTSASHKRSSSGVVAESRETYTRSLLPVAVSACLAKEFRYLKRSGAQLYSLIVPPFMVFIFAARSSAMSQTGLQSKSVSSYLFTYGCAYTLLVFVSFMYNSLGNDAAGVQFYFIAPVRMRDVILAKNILAGCLLAVEIGLIYLSASLATKPPTLDVTVATFTWMLFAIFINMSIGNVRSITAPKLLQAGKVRRQNVSGLSSLISFGVILGAFGLGAAALLLCRYLGTGYWAVSLIFLLLAGIAFGGYLLGLQRVDSIASEHNEGLTKELTKGT